MQPENDCVEQLVFCVVESMRKLNLVSIDGREHNARPFTLEREVSTSIGLVPMATITSVYRTRRPKVSMASSQTSTVSFRGMARQC